jgi:hypothetical protein
MMMRGLRLGISKEEKVANIIGRQLSDYSLDLEAVGKYLAVAQPYLIYRRALEVLEAAEYNKQVVEYNRLGYYSDKIL